MMDLSGEPAFAHPDHASESGREQTRVLSSPVIQGRGYEDLFILQTSSGRFTILNKNVQVHK